MKIEWTGNFRDHHGQQKKYKMLLSGQFKILIINYINNTIFFYKKFLSFFLSKMFFDFAFPASSSRQKHETCQSKPSRAIRIILFNFPEKH